MEEGNTGYPSAAENGNAVQEIELVKALEPATNAQDVHMAQDANQDTTRLEAEPMDETIGEADCEQEVDSDTDSNYSLTNQGKTRLEAEPWNAIGEKDCEEEADSSSDSNHSLANQDTTRLEVELREATIGEKDCEEEADSDSVRNPSLANQDATGLEAELRDEIVCEKDCEEEADLDSYCNNSLANQDATRLEAELRDESTGEKDCGEEADSDSYSNDSLANEDTTRLEAEPKGETVGKADYKGEANSGSDSNHSLSNQDTTRLEAELREETIGEAYCEEDAVVCEEEAKEEKEKSDDGNEGNVSEILRLTSKEEIKKGKKVNEEISETVSHVVAESSARRISPIRHMEPKWYKAAVEGKVDILKDYMERPDWRSRLRTALSPAGNSILHIHVAAPREARTINQEFLETALMDSELSLRELMNDRRETPLHTAANFGQIEAVKLFVEKDPSLLTLINVEGDTALHMAARNKQSEVVEHMLEFSNQHSNPNSNLMNYTANDAGETPLFLAVQTGCLELVASMLNTIGTEQSQEQEQLVGSERTGSILQASVLWGNSEMAKQILEKFPTLIKLRDEAGQTAFHYAAGIDNDMLRVIIQQQDENSPSAAYIQDIEGRTAAHIAAQQNNIDGLKLLMEHFPDCCEITDNQGRNVVHYAAFLGRIEALEFFLRDARFCDLINKKDDDGNTPLHLLASSLTELPYATLRHLQLLLPELKALHLNIYNTKELTPGDIANAFKVFELEPAYQDVVREFRAVAPKGGRVKRWIQPLNAHKLDIEAQRKDLASDLLKTVKFHMVVSTLIATVSFAAGLGVPGGFNQDTKDNVKGGSAMLGNKAAFRVFVVSDCIALTFSLIAILCYFWIAVGKGKGSSKALFFKAFEASTVSIFALMVAFMSGTYSILQPSNKHFAFLVLLILSIFVYLYLMFAICVIKLRQRMNRRMLGPRTQKMKIDVLHGQVDTDHAHSPLGTFKTIANFQFSGVELSKILTKTSILKLFGK